MCLMGEAQFCKDCGRSINSPIQQDKCWGCKDKPAAAPAKASKKKKQK